MKAEPSFWIDAPREQFAARCIARFGVTFDQADCFVVRADYIPVRNRPHAIRHGLPSLADTLPRRNGTVQGMGTRLSTKAMKGAKLV